MNQFADKSRRGKYNNRVTMVDGIKFHSLKEGERYAELKLMERAKLITALTLQPKFELIPGDKRNGKVIRATYYIADFQYKDEHGNIVVEDVKGHKTKEYLLKKKLFEHLYKMSILET